MTTAGWRTLLDGAPGSQAKTAILSPRTPNLCRRRASASSRTVRAPEFLPFADDDPYGWPVNEYQEAWELGPGLEQVGRQLVAALAGLGRGRPGHGIAAEKAARQPLLAAAPGGEGRRPAPRTLRRPAAAGPVAHPGRQGPRPLDAVRRQRTGAGTRLLEELFHRPRQAGAGGTGDRFHPPAAGRGLRRRDGRRRSPAPRRLPHPADRRPRRPVLAGGARLPAWTARYLTGRGSRCAA